MKYAKGVNAKFKMQIKVTIESVILSVVEVLLQVVGAKPSSEAKSSRKVRLAELRRDLVVEEENFVFYYLLDRHRVIGARSRHYVSPFGFGFATLRSG